MQFSKEHMQPFLNSHALKAKEIAGAKWIWSFSLHNDISWTGKHLHCARRYFKNQKMTERLVIVPAEGETGLLTIEGHANITKYYYDELPAFLNDDAVAKWTRRQVFVSEMMPDEFPILVKSAIVEDAPISAPSYDGWEGISKYYRLETEFTDERDEVIFRTRFIRSSKDPYESMALSGVSRAPVQVEFDMICKKETGIPVILGCGLEYIQMIMDTGLLLSKQEQTKVLEEYDTLVYSEVNRRQFHRPSRGKQRDAEPLEEVEMAGEHHFLAPKPITLEQIHLTKPSPLSYGINSILRGYAVTDKADGERMLFFINSEGRGYLINNTFDVVDTGLQTTSKTLCHTLLDGEFVGMDERRDGITMDLFAVFDIYFLGGKSTMQLPLFHSTGHDRVHAMAQAVEKKMWDRKNAQMELRCKEHIAAEADEMYKACHDFLFGAANLPYKMDGLIFTPTELSVFGYYPGVSVPIPENVRWDKVLKWKPAEQNTIDFLVEEVKQYRDPDTLTNYKSFKIYTGYNASQWEHISVMDGVRLRYDRDFAQVRRNMTGTYRARLFDPITNFQEGVQMADVPVDAKGDCVCQDGSIITTNSIVEFGYDLDADVPVSRRWKPLRVREDKTRVFQRTKKLSKTANDRSVAFNIWRSIHSPVTPEMITGAEPVPLRATPDTLEERLLGTDDIYYAREIPRQRMLSVHMLDFHNQGVKLMLYKRAQKKDALLELACGKAGDLPRWRDGGFRFVLGVDFVKDNITNPHDGAYARMIKQNAVLKRADSGMTPNVYSDYVFVVGDCSKALHTGEAAEGLDDESKKLTQMLYHRNMATAGYHRHIAGRASQGFSMVSCMFAIHYFFRNQEMLNGFFFNVANNLRKDGIFIATFMDGDAVNDLLEKSQDGKVEGRKLNDAIPVWAILRHYVSYDKEDAFGKVVEVFLENTNRLIPEYLVCFDTLVEKAKEFGLEVEESQMFSHTFYNLKAEFERNPSMRVGRMDSSSIDALSKDPIQTRFSFLNRWVVFRKVR